MLEFRVLGPVEIVAEGRALPLKAAKQKTILALLLLHRDEVVSVDRLQEALWAEQPPATASTALQGYVSQLRRLLESGEQGAASLLVTRSPGYALTTAAEQIDLARFEQLAESGREALAAGEPARAAGLLAEALTLWRGPPLADFAYEAWAQAAIGRLEELRLSALEDRIEADLACGRHGELVGELETLIAEQPLRERLRGQLMLALYRGGRQAEALEAYQAARHALVEELGIEPSPKLQSLNHSILNQDEALAAPRRALAARGPIELPLPAAPLVGRERELEELVELLKSDEIRLLTMTGAGGAGKTRLALEVATGLVEEYPDGVFFVSLAPIRDPALVVPTIAQTLGVKDQAERPLAATLARELAGKTTLLFLDNFEQVVESAPVVAELLERAPRLNVLATSREPLHLGAEHEYEVSPLAESEAVELFRARATNGEPLATVAAICRRLDGLPLAIELAAARTKVLPPTKLLDRIEQRLPLLTGKRRDVPARQQTLRATIGWSYELLSDDEKQLFRRLSVVSGGCTLEAAEAVCETDLDTLQSLVEKSLLRFSSGRYWMLETIREFAREQLRDLGEDDAIARRHASYFLELAQDTEVRMSGPEQAASLQRLEQEHDNARAVFDWAVENDIETALALGNALQRLWYLHGYAHEGLERLAAALDRDDRTPSLTRARALRTAGALAEACSELTRARELLGQSITLLRGLDQPKELAMSLNNQGAIAVHQGDYEAARRAFEESLELKRALEDTTGTLMTSSNLAILEGKLGEYELARRRHEDILPSLRELGSPYALSNGLASLGEIALLCGDQTGGRCALEESLELRREVGDKAGILESQALLSRADCADRDRVSAELRLREGLELAQEIDDPGMLLVALEARADLDAFLGDAARAIALRTAAARMRSEIGAPFLKADTTWRERAVAAARDRLSGEDYPRALAEGEAASAEEVLAWAQAPVGVPAAAAR